MFVGVGRPGGDLLSRVLGRSTMGAGVFHGRVRDGIGWGDPAMATRSSSPGGHNALSGLSLVWAMRTPSRERDGSPSRFWFVLCAWLRRWPVRRRSSCVWMTAMHGGLGAHRTCSMEP